ncbi:hypothetical protein [Oscillatoria sp. FACHB-1406]|uniref:hypothetical protein n=1 Tax=Oscillatoria sp. FACHB-1406 TaxID=2692846 RepID=UPI0016836E9E|nr:hypothetical protein [Oscillatoria sp. FACHB-1406]MBD2577523.1 hypothetical protein [Oscillatoria sp. FACHB-1406]
MGLTSVSKPQGKRIYKQPSARSHSFPLRYLQLPAFILTGLGIALAFYFGVKHLPLAPQTETFLPTVTPSLSAPIVQSDPFAEAVKSATTAAQLAQVAKTSSDWQLVAQQWQTAATLMNSVPSDRVQFNLARQKAVEYEKNFQYARKNAEK